MTNNLFGAILWRKWEIEQVKEGDIQRIIGYWAEDGNPYYMIVPQQLLKTIVKFQNFYSDIYNDIQNLKFRMECLTRYFEK